MERVRFVMKGGVVVRNDLTGRPTESQKKAAAEYKAIRGTEPGGPPWSVVLRVPSLLVPTLQIRMHYLNDSALDQRLTEFAILIAARRWTNNFEFNAHSGAAAKAGLKRRSSQPLAKGDDPSAWPTTKRSCTNSVRNCWPTRASVIRPTLERWRSSANPAWWRSRGLRAITPTWR